MVAAQPDPTDRQKTTYRQLLLSGTPMSPQERLAAATWIGEPELAGLPPPKQMDPGNRFARGRLFVCGQVVADDNQAATRIAEEDEGLAEVLYACGVVPEGDATGVTSGAVSANGAAARDEAATPGVVPPGHAPHRSTFEAQSSAMPSGPGVDSTPTRPPTRPGGTAPGVNARPNVKARASDSANGASPGRRTRAEQSRINGAGSRGPKTIDGRLAACMNAFRHGMRSRLGVLPDEDVVKFQAFADGVVFELQPTTPLQRDLARRVADLSWRLRRLPVLESHAVGGTSCPTQPEDTDANTINDRLLEAIGRDGILPRLQRYATSLERSIRSCLRELRQLQAAECATAGTSAAPWTAAAPAAAAPRDIAVESPTPGAVPPGNAPHRSAFEAQSSAMPSAPGADSTSARPRHDPARPGDTVPGVGAATAADLSGSGRRANAPSSADKLSAGKSPGGRSPSDGMRFSGSFGATLMPMSTMPLSADAVPISAETMPISAKAAPISAEAAAVAVSGSFGKKSRAARRPIAIANDIVPIPATPPAQVAAT